MLLDTQIANKVKCHQLEAVKYFRVEKKKIENKRKNLINKVVVRALALRSKALSWKWFYSLWATRGLDTQGRRLYSN